jgi:hypothetical protein
MNPDGLNKWLTLVANVGVIAGLIFLGIEINQNTRATIASASEEITNQSLDYFALGMDNEVIARGLFKQATGRELDDFERDQLWRHQFYNFRVFQNVFMQYHRGFLEETEWNTYAVVLRSRLNNDPNARKMWEDTAGGWNPIFEAEVHSILARPIDKSVTGFN